MVDRFCRLIGLRAFPETENLCFGVDILPVVFAVTLGTSLHICVRFDIHLFVFGLFVCGTALRENQVFRLVALV
jgi:hypothetical protein